jgi:hypothetical protein
MGVALLDTHLTLEEVLAERSVPARDCRDCIRFERDPDGLDCGWCTAHDMWVKLYQSPDSWHSQCQFLQLRMQRRIEMPVQPRVWRQVS